MIHKLTKSLFRFSKRFSVFKTMSSKPLNILVVTENNCFKTYKNLEKNVYKCVSSNDYLVYQILDSELQKLPWMDSTALLVIVSKTIDKTESAILEEYFRQSGKILLICSKFKTLAGYICSDNPDVRTIVKIKLTDVGEISLIRGKYGYKSHISDILFRDHNNKPVIQKVAAGKSICIASEVYIDRDTEFIQEKHSEVLSFDGTRLLIFKSLLTKNLGLKPVYEDFKKDLSAGYYMCIGHETTTTKNETSVFCQCSVKYQEENVEINIYHYCKNVISIPFDIDLYFSTLNTDVFGKKFIYFSTVTSTMDIVEQIPNYEGVIFASIQLSGKGRGANKWISPLGCAMFTLSFKLELFSRLGQKLSMIQHIAALAVVSGIRSNKQYKDLNLKIKWPNDIYFDNFKVGGLLVTSMIEGNVARIKIGWGINITNSSPTVCLQDAIRMHNEKYSCNVPNIQIEEAVAFTINQMEYFIKDFQNTGPSTTFLHYYTYWMHGDQKVTIDQSNEKGTITGIDEYGFLMVKTSKGKEVSLQPDGNRFDMTQNLIFVK